MNSALFTHIQIYFLYAKQHICLHQFVQTTILLGIIGSLRMSYFLPKFLNSTKKYYLNYVQRLNWSNKSFDLERLMI